MTSIAVNYQPFLTNQIVYAYNGDGSIIEERAVPLADVSNTVMALSNKYHVDEINLFGNQDYLSRFKAEMGTKFSENVNINIIGR